MRRPTILMLLAAAVPLGCAPRPTPAPPPRPVATVRPVTPPTPSTDPSPAGVTVQVMADGRYTVTHTASGWSFNGTLGQPVTDTRRTAGHDVLGDYAGVAFATVDEDGPIAAEVRAYAARPVVLFRWTTPGSRPSPPTAFPAVSIPDGLHTFSYGDGTFGQPDFTGRSGGTPWLLFDDAGRAAVLSPADDFMVADMHAVDRPADDYLSPTVVASDLNAGLINLPAGYTHQSVLAFGDHIVDAWQTWGHALTDLAGKHRPTNTADVGLAKLGMWTNTGGEYYYNYDPARGYAGTVKDAADTFRRRGVPLGYVEVDSWWYQKSTTKADGSPGPPIKSAKYPAGSWNAYGGLLKYEASPDVFPNGLAAWQRTVGLPLMTHARWVDVNSPYRDRYRISGVAAVDPQYWADRATYLHAQGVVNFVQDWLTEAYKQSPQLGTTTWAGDAFTDGMAHGMAAHGLSVQYCMATPRFFLQGSKYDNLTTVRVGDDRFARLDWNRNLYTSQLVTALGEWPFMDNFRSYETPNLTLAVLSAGMVGLGDGAEESDVPALLRAARPDGLLVKPDTAIVPLDRTYVSDATFDQTEPMVAAAYTDHGPLRTAYVFTFPRQDKKQDAIAFRPAELGLPGDCWVYEPKTGIGRRVAAGDTFTDTFVDYRAPWASYVVAPIGNGGIALLGDAGKIASMGRQRIPSAEATPTGVRLTVSFAVGERSVTLHGYADAAPTVTVQNGTAGPVGFDPRTHRFTVDVSPIGSVNAVVTLAGRR